MTPQTPPTDRPLTAGDVPLLREGDVLRSHRKRHFVRCVAAGVIVLEYAAFTAAEFEAARFTFVSRQKVDGGLPDIEAEGERIVRDTYKREGDFGYLWTDVVGAVQTAISEERARHPARPATSAASEGAIASIIAERARQVSVEGWTPEHDDEHDDHSLGRAAASYAGGVDCGSKVATYTDDVSIRGECPVWGTRKKRVPVPWPDSWDPRWWKPTGDRRRDLVKAGALIVAEIERLDRKVAK